MKKLVLKLALTSALMCLAVLVFALLPSCGKKKSAPASINVSPAQSQDERTASRPEVPPLDELLEQLRELQKPPQVTTM